MKPIRVSFDFTPAQYDSLVDYAMRHGFLRENPRRRMSATDRRQAIDYAIRHAAETAAGVKPVFT
jgi:hypothetical protein